MIVKIVHLQNKLSYIKSMDIISYIHKSVELLFQILGLVEVWTHRSMELSPEVGNVGRGKRRRMSMPSSQGAVREV